MKHYIFFDAKEEDLAVSIYNECNNQFKTEAHKFSDDSARIIIDYDKQDGLKLHNMLRTHLKDRRNKVEL